MKTIREYQEKVEYLFNLNHTALNQSYLEVTGSTCASAYEVKDKIFQKHMKDGTLDLFI